MKSPKLLEFFPTHKRSFVGNLLLGSIRKGITSYEGIKQQILNESIKRKKYGVNETVELLLELSNNENLFQEAVNHYIEWEKLPLSEKNKLKSEKEKIFMERYMESQPPTLKQVNFLKLKGVKEIPTSKLQASNMINKIINTHHEF